MALPNLSKGFAVDAAPGLIKRALGSAAVTADGYVGVQFDQLAATITSMICVIDVEAIDVANADEAYTFRIVGSNQADRSDGQVLGTLEIGASGGVPLQTVNAAAGDRDVIRFRTEKNNVDFRYVDLHLDVAGTSPSITFGAFLSKEF